MRYGHRAWLAVIVLLGLALRVSGIAYGLPYHHHWDEWWIVDSVLGMVRRRDTVPGSYQYGEPLMWLTEAVFFLARRLQHAGATLSVVDAQSTIYLAGRLATALVAATGTVGVYLAACHARAGRWSAPRRGLWAALLYAVSSVLVLHARYAVTDACLAALTAWTLAFAALYLERGKLRWGIACVAAAGVTCAFKMPGVVTVLVPLLAALWRFARPLPPTRTRRPHGALLLATVPAVAAAYVVLNPHVIDHSQEALRDLVGRYRQTRDGGFSSVYIRTPGVPHLASAIAGIVTRFPSRSTAVSVAVSAVSAWGLAREIRRGTAAMGIAAAYMVCLVLSVALPNRTFLFRNYLVVVPSIAMGFGTGVVELWSVLGARVRVRGTPWRWGWAAIPALAGALLVGLPLHDAFGAQRLSDDPRVRAIDWIESHTGHPASERVAVTSSVFGKLAQGAFPGLRGVLDRPPVPIAEVETDVCPDPSGGPTYILEATFRDAHRAPATDPWQPVWFFEDCSGYDRVATFAANPYEVDVAAYPTWPGRVEAIVLRRRD